jgi:hypothetical protein
MASMQGRSSPVGAGVLALLALAAPGCLAVYLPDQDLTSAVTAVTNANIEARVLEIRAEPFLRTALATASPPNTRLRAVAVSTEAGSCDGALAVLQTLDGQPVVLPAAIGGPRRLEIYLPEPARLADGPAWLALAFDGGPATAPGCLTVPLVAPSITWRRERAWRSAGFIRGENATSAAAGSGLLLILGGWWRHSGQGRLGLSGELALAAGWCGDFIACKEARVIGTTSALGGQLRLVRGQRWLLEGELAAEVTTAISTGTSSLWLLATPRATVRLWRTGPRLLGFSPDLRLGALGVELTYGHRFAWADGRAGQAPVIGLGMVVQPAL